MGYTFNSISNTIKIYPAPTFSVSLISNSTIYIGQQVVYNAIVNGGVGPFTLKLIAYSANVLATNTVTLPGGSALLSYTTISNTPNSFEVIGFDDGTSSSYLFNSISNTVTILTPPANVVVKIMNSQSTATTNGMQQEITFDPTNDLFNGIVASDLGNVRFYSGPTELYSWCEHGCSSSASYSTFWVKLPFSIGAHSSNNINMTFSIYKY